MRHICVACISIDSVMTVEKKNDHQGYFEEYKLKIKKKSKFIDNKLELDFDSDSEKLKFFTFSNAFSLYLV